MLRKVCTQRSTSDGISLDAADLFIIESVYKKNLREGEERLMLAVLENAVEYFQKYVLARKPSGKQRFQEAEDWFLETDGDGLFSFENICETLGLHPDHIRKGLMIWKAARLKMSAAESHNASRPRLAKSRVTRPSIGLSKTEF